MFLFRNFRQTTLGGDSGLSLAEGDETGVLRDSVVHIHSIMFTKTISITVELKSCNPGLTLTPGLTLLTGHDDLIISISMLCHILLIYYFFHFLYLRATATMLSEEKKIF